MADGKWLLRGGEGGAVAAVSPWWQNEAVLDSIQMVLVIYSGVQVEGPPWQKKQFVHGGAKNVGWVFGDVVGGVHSAATFILLLGF